MAKVSNGSGLFPFSIPVLNLDDSVIMWLDENCTDDWAWQWEPNVIQKKLYFKRQEDLIYFKLNHAKNTGQ